MSTESIRFDFGDEGFIWRWPSSPVALDVRVLVGDQQEVLLVRGGRVVATLGPGQHVLGGEALSGTGAITVDGRFQGEVWFVNTSPQREIPWSTHSPIPVYDPFHGAPVGVRAFGIWGMRVADSSRFGAEVMAVGLPPASRVVEEYMSALIVRHFGSALGGFAVERKLAPSGVNSHLGAFSEGFARGVRAELLRFGVDLVDLRVQRVVGR